MNRRSLLTLAGLAIAATLRAPLAASEPAS